MINVPGPEISVDVPGLKVMLVYVETLLEVKVYAEAPTAPDSVTRGKINKF